MSSELLRATLSVIHLTECLGEYLPRPGPAPGWSTRFTVCDVGAHEWTAALLVLCARLPQASPSIFASSLAADPRMRSVRASDDLAVMADELQSRGDLLGELICAHLTPCQACGGSALRGGVIASPGRSVDGLSVVFELDESVPAFYMDYLLALKRTWLPIQRRPLRHVSSFKIEAAVFRGQAGGCFVSSLDCQTCHGEGTMLPLFERELLALLRRMRQRRVPVWRS